MYVTDRKKIHFTFQDGTEMAEEYDINTGDLLGECKQQIFSVY